MVPFEAPGPSDPQVPPTHTLGGARQESPLHQAVAADGATGKQASPAQRLSAGVPLALITTPH